MHREYAELLYFCRAMKKLTLITLIVLTLASCAKTDDEQAREMLTRIHTLYESGNYRATLDSITLLRDRYPAAIEVRKEALVVWQNASLKMAQADVAATDVLLQHARREARLAAGALRRHVRCGEDDQDATEERAERPEQNREASAEVVKTRLRLLNS